MKDECCLPSMLFIIEGVQIFDERGDNGVFGKKRFKNVPAIYEEKNADSNNNNNVMIMQIMWGNTSS